MFIFVDSASLPYKFLTRLPGVCSGGGGFPPETYIIYHAHMYTYIHIYAYMYPKNPAPRNHLLVQIVKPSDCHCTDGHLTRIVFPEDRNVS